ncbi:Nose resistant to fluoxetine protein 6 like protein [Argiope bruennichi]|uniref:Nose resistant to fluoxetine protein 6 like protein n=1 Tax=Argiope bruennichi TaxID=94029 RepID=A0A8T0EWA3_ARGBR|nr:Nose resistant to fluoxetine protein 6 like protein [Argiope bruennichi]
MNIFVSQCMADATGKLPGGVLEGTVMAFGSYTECLKIRVKHSSNGKENFRGRYCMIGYKSPLLSPLHEKTPAGDSYVDAYGVPPSWVTMLINRTGPYLTRVAFWFGTCVPSSCTEDDVKEIFTSVTKPLGMSVKLAGCETDEPGTTWPTSALIALCFLCLILGTCLLGTILDVIIRYQVETQQHSEPDFVTFRILRAFSLYSNTEKLFAGTSGNDTLSCFHGIRFFSAVWIILGHTYFFTDTWKYMKYRDALAIDDYFNYFLPTAVLENFTVPVGSFFFMSGFLLVFATWKKLEKSNGKLDLFMFFVHKYWRMTPALGLMILLLFTLPIIGSGPLWNSALDPPVSACENHWWTNLLYINNFWGSENYCLVHTWYLAALMQFHIIGIVILLLSFRWPNFGIFLGFTTAVASCVTTALLVIWNDFPMPTPAINKDMDVMEEYNTKSQKPFCHVPTYLIGMAFAFLVLKWENKRERVNFGIVNRLLSWNVFIPLGHLSYLVYLLHPLIMLYRTASMRERISYGHTELVFEFLTYTVIAFFLAYIGHIAVEKPFLILEGIFFRKRPLENLKNPVNSKEPVLTCQIKTVPA